MSVFKRFTAEPIVHGKSFDWLRIKRKKSKQSTLWPISMDPWILSTPHMSASQFNICITNMCRYTKKTSRHFSHTEKKNQAEFLTRTKTEQNWNQFEILPIWFLSTADISVEHNMNISLAFKYSLQFLGLVWFWVFNFHSNRTFVRIYPALLCSVQFTQFQCHLKMFRRCGDV